MKTSRTTSFDGWMLRADSGELSKGGHKIRLQDQPLLVLVELLAHPGELVTREQLIARLWPKGVVDFDTGLNTAVRKLRVALDDVGETPRYIETLPRKGYRFVGTIDPPLAEAAPAPALTPAVPAQSIEPSSAPPPQSLNAPGVSRRWLGYAIAAAAVIGLGFLIFALTRQETAKPLVAAPTTVVPAQSLDERTVAVLPLKAATTTEPDLTLAEILSDLLRQRLGRLENITVIGSSSTSLPDNAQADPRKFGGSVHARYLLVGRVGRAGDQVHVELELLDVRSGAKTWSLDQDRAVSELASVVEDLVRRAAVPLQARADAGTASLPSAAINLDAYRVYLQAQKLMETQRNVDNDSALASFRRATVLDPRFARAYLGVAQALMFASNQWYLDADDIARKRQEARDALARALALDPGLGEAIIERARLTDDPAEAEKLFHEALRLAPNYGAGYARYAEFLFDEYRRGEAIEAMDRARALDPLKPRLHLRQALFRMVASSDVEAHDRLVREALALNPNLVFGLSELGHSRYMWSGEFAEGIQLCERAIQLDPEQDGLKVELAAMYLDVDDPAAALALLKEVESKPTMLVEIALYQRDPRRAAELARAVPDDQWGTMTLTPEASALRDEAILTGNFAPALERIGKRFAMPMVGREKGGLRMWNRGLGLAYAHTLVLAGEGQRGRKLALTILALLDSEAVGRKQNFLSRDRAIAFAILGDKENAIAELKNSMSINHYTNWWYWGELDPVFADLRSDPRFQALAAQAKQHRAQQRALLDEMRRTGQVPKR